MVIFLFGHRAVGQVVEGRAELSLVPPSRRRRGRKPVERLVGIAPLFVALVGVVRGKASRERREHL